MLTIIIVGGLGTGKTTLANKMKEGFDCLNMTCVIHEEMEQYIHNPSQLPPVGTTNILILTFNNYRKLLVVVRMLHLSPIDISLIDLDDAK